jgi:ribonucleoside-diphosphate reductase alpha chain
MRVRLPDTRKSITHRATIRTGKDKVKFFITVGLYESGKPAELFLTFDQTGSTIDGFADCWATAISLCLQSGITLEKIVEKFSFHQFDPQGFTDNEHIPMARSVVDYTVRWMEKQFNDKTSPLKTPVHPDPIPSSSSDK